MTEASLGMVASPMTAKHSDNLDAVLAVGDPAPWLRQRSASNPRHTCDTAAGRYIVLCLYGSAADPTSWSALEAVVVNQHHVNGVRVCFFGVSLDPRDEAQARVRDSMPGPPRLFFHSDGICRLYDALPREAPAGKDECMVRTFDLGRRTTYLARRERSRR